MRGDEQSLDIVVRSEDGLSLSLGAGHMDVERLVFFGTLIDPETPPPGNVTISVDIAPEFVEGAHVERVTEWTLLTDNTETSFSWEVESRELAGGYVFHDARVHAEADELRAFAIEDLVASIGIGVAAGVGAFWVVRTGIREWQQSREARRLWEDCLARGGSPTWSCSVEDEAGLDTRGLLRIKSRVTPSVHCEMPATTN